MGRMVNYLTPPIRFSLYGERFYVRFGRVGSDKKFIFYTAVQGTYEDVNKFKVKYGFEDPKTGYMDVVTVSGVIPIDIINDVEKIIETGCYGSVTDNMMKRYYSVGGDGNVRCHMKIEINE